MSEWQRSIINHLYWCVSSTNNDKSDLIKAKWLSLDNHIHNVHRKHSKDFPKCAHGKLKGQDRKRKWFKRRMFVEFSCMHEHTYLYIYNIVMDTFSDTKASEKLTSLIQNSNHLKDITRLSSAYQTSSLESFHNVVIHFAPKSIAFSYMGMKSR